jgi:TrpR-related protein YerC/YecD
MKKWKTTEMQELFRAFLFLKDENEVGMFLRDVCTINELIEIAKRFSAARMIEKGESIREIARKTAISPTTVSRVSQWKHSLGEGGYDLVLKRMSKKG